MRRLATTVLATTALLIGGLGLQPASAAGYPPCTITGTAVGETITGTEGNDVICTGGGNDTVNALGGNDIIIVSGSGIDTINGGSGNDTIDAALGTDSTIDAGTGDDTVYGTSGDDEITAGDGADVIDGNAGADLIFGGDGVDNLTGDIGNDTITGEAGNDTIYGSQGEDTLSGSAGDDLIFGGDGVDNLTGDTGNDTITGEAGNDTIYGSQGDDTLTGSAGNDSIFASGSGVDTVNGGSGNDIIDQTTGTDSTIDAGLGDDIVFGTPGDDEISAGDGSDTVDGNAGDDTITGGEGNDEITGDSGNDTITGDVGDDTINGDSGNDTLNGTLGDDKLIGGEGVDNLNGGLGNDSLEGNAGNDNLYGDSGTDNLVGGAGNDVVSGGSDLDILDGGLGLNICDYEVGEALTTSCTYDDSSPIVSSVQFGTTSLDSTVTDQLIPVSLDFNDGLGFSSLHLVCSLSSSGITYKSVDATFTRDLGRDNFHSSNLNNYRLEGNITSGRVITSVPIIKGTFPGTYACNVIARDIMNHESNYPAVSSFSVTRGLTGWDDRAPLLTTVDFSRAAVDSAVGGVDIELHLVVEDETQIDWGYFTCANEENYRGVQLIFNRSTVYDYQSGRYTQPRFSSDTRIEYYVPIKIAESQQTGNYSCYSSVKDAIHHEETFVGLASIVITDTQGLSDSSPPELVSSSMSETIFDVGSKGAKATLNFRLRDRSGLGWSYLNCEFENNGILHRILGSVVAPFIFYDYANGWVPGATFSGSAKDLTASIPINIPFGTYPGKYDCWIGASDSHMNGARYVLSTFTVFRTPSGQPSAPLSISFSPKSSNSGTLSWESPDNKGTPTLNSYVSQYSLDGSTWLPIPNGTTTGTAFDVKGLTVDTDYWFRVRGENGSTSGQDTTLMNLNWATLKIHTPGATAPTKPSELIVDLITASSFKVQWSVPLDDGGSRINDFKIETSRDGGQTWTLTKTGVSTSTSLSVSGAAPGTTYLVRIAAVNGVGQSEYLTGSVTTLATIPSSPKNLISSNLGTNSVSLGWSLPDTNGGSAITDYRVEVTSNGSNSWTVTPHTASNSLGFNVTNLLPGRTYQFRVSAVTSAGVGAASEIITVTTNGVVGPNAPTSLTVSNVKTNAASVSWSAVVATQKVNNYLVDVSTDGSSWVPVNKRASTSTSLSLSGLRLGTSYQIRVAAVNVNGAGDYVYGSFTTLPTVASSPTFLSAASVSGSGFNLNWTAPATHGGSVITDYVVEINGGGFNWAPVAHSPSKITDIDINALNPGVKYSVRVKAVNGVGVSKVSSTLSVTTLAVLPSSPVVTLKSVTATGAVLNWVAPANGGAKISDYKVEYSTDGGNTWLTVSKSASTSTSLTLKNLKTKTSYLFRVSAKNSVGYSAPSSNLIVVTP